MKMNRNNKIIIAVYSIILIIAVIIAAVIALIPSNLTIVKSDSKEQPIAGKNSEYDYYDQTWTVRTGNDGKSYIVVQNPSYSSCETDIKARAVNKDNKVYIKITIEDDNSSCISRDYSDYQLYTITSNDDSIDLKNTAQITVSNEYKGAVAYTSGTSSVLSKS